MEWVREYCNAAMLLERGHIIAAGQPDEVVAVHEEHSARQRAERAAAGVMPVGYRPSTTVGA
jgi:ABC-type polysaccharide/polyol phosphate transport system ATPase subunit